MMQTCFPSPYFVGYSCSDLGGVCKEAAMAPVREIMQNLPSDGTRQLLRLRKLLFSDFSAAAAMVRPTAVDQASYV